MANEAKRSKSPETLHCLIKDLSGSGLKLGLGQDNLDGRCSFFESLDLVKEDSRVAFWLQPATVYDCAARQENRACHFRNHQAAVAFGQAESL